MIRFCLGRRVLARFKRNQNRDKRRRLGAQLVCSRAVIERFLVGNRWVWLCVALALFIGVPGTGAAETPQRTHRAHHRAAPKLPKKPAQHAAAPKPKKRAVKPKPRVATAKPAPRHKPHEATTPTSRHAASNKAPASAANPRHKPHAPSVYVPPPDLKAAPVHTLSRAPEPPPADGATPASKVTPGKVPAGVDDKHAPEVPAVAQPKAPVEPTPPEVPAPKGYDTPSEPIPAK